MAYRTKICDNGGIFNVSRPSAYSAETRTFINGMTLVFANGSIYYTKKENCHGIFIIASNTDIYEQNYDITIELCKFSSQCLAISSEISYFIFTNLLILYV